MFLRLTKLQRSRNIHYKMEREKGEKKRPPLQSITEEEKRREEFRPRFCHRSVGQKSLGMSVRRRRRRQRALFVFRGREEEGSRGCSLGGQATKPTSKVRGRNLNDDPGHARRRRREKNKAHNKYLRRENTHKFVLSVVYSFVEFT